jgi:hypothetical protein
LRSAGIKIQPFLLVVLSDLLPDLDGGFPFWMEAFLGATPPGCLV